MSWTKHVTLYCDNPDCDNFSMTDFQYVGRARDSRADWIYKNGKDICPDCRED